MKEETPREKLATVLAHIGVSRDRDHAKLAGVSVMQLANAIMGRPVATVAYLRLCIAYGHDPLPELPHFHPDAPSDFDHDFLAVGFRVWRGFNGQSVREAGAAIGVSGFTISRLENGHIMSIGVVLRACRYVRVHPFGYLRSTAFTGNKHSNSLNLEKKRVEAVI